LSWSIASMSIQVPNVIKEIQMQIKKIVIIAFMMITPLTASDWRLMSMHHAGSDGVKSGKFNLMFIDIDSLKRNKDKCTIRIKHFRQEDVISAAHTIKNLGALANEKINGGYIPDFITLEKNVDLSGVDLANAKLFTVMNEITINLSPPEAIMIELCEFNYTKRTVKRLHAKLLVDGKWITTENSTAKYIDSDAPYINIIKYISTLP